MSTAPDQATASPGPSHRLRPLLGIGIIGFALTALLTGVLRQSAVGHVDVRQGPSGSSDAASPATSGQSALPLAIVYYVHGQTRCPTCLSIEAATRKAIQNNFAEAVDKGQLVYQEVNFDQPAGRHFRTDYQVAFGTVIVQSNQPGRPWKNLSDVWTLIHDDPWCIESYLVEEIKPLLVVDP